MTSLGERSPLPLTPVALDPCSSVDGMYESQPMLERKWRGDDRSANEVAATLRRRLVARGWADHSAGSEIIRMVSPATGGPRFEAEVSVEADGDANQGTITISVRDAAPCG